jgi:hypothetical protein
MKSWNGSSRAHPTPGARPRRVLRGAGGKSNSLDGGVEPRSAQGHDEEKRLDSISAHTEPWGHLTLRGHALASATDLPRRMCRRGCAAQLPGSVAHVVSGCARARMSPPATEGDR